MSSSISADYSPTSNYSHITDPSVSPTLPIREVRLHNDHVGPPRLSSPHIFRDFFARDVPGPSTGTPPQLPPLHEINFAETMQDVNRALQSANRAIQTAQEAFQSRRTPSTIANHRQEDVVDLTNSPPIPTRGDRAIDSFLTRTLNPYNTRAISRATDRSLDEDFYPRATSSIGASSLFVEEDDLNTPYAGQTDSVAAARRRYQAQQLGSRRSFMSIPNMGRTLLRSGLPNIRRQEEEAAIRRQRIAREQWEQNQQRQQQRDRLQQQRDRILAAGQQRSRHPNQNAQTLSNPSSQHAIGSSSGARNPASLLSRPSTSSSHSSSTSSIDSVDLTAVNNTSDLNAALVLSQDSNPTTKPFNSTGSALTAYKCPICLEPPRNATSTICGHLFCHECILETLKNSENIRREDAPPHRKVKGQCPVCRKELARREEGISRTLVPLEIKLISKKKMEELRKQERKRQRKAAKEGKGKGKERDVADHDKDVFELSSDGEDELEANGGSQKENKYKRLKRSASEEVVEELFGEELFDAFTNTE